jgi:sugar phosphate isomerase/epimerase
MKNPLCLNSNTYHGFSLGEAVQGARQSGVGFIELSAVRDWTSHVSADMSNGEITSTLSLLSDSGIRAIALGGHANLISPAGLDQFRENLKLAHRLGVDYVVTGTGETHGDEELVEDEGRLVDDLRGLAVIAADLGLGIAIETHGANYDTGRRVHDLVTRVGYPNLGVNYDTGNVIFYGDVEPYDDLEACAPAVTGIHLKDKAGKPREWNFPAIGSGDIEFSRIFSILERTECSAPFSIEIEFTPAGPADVEEVHQAVADSVRTITALTGAI